MRTKKRKRTVRSSKTPFYQDVLKGVGSWLGRLSEKLLIIGLLLFAANYAIDHKLNLKFLSKVTQSDKSKLKTEDGEVAKANVYMDRNIVVIQQKDKEPKVYVGVKEAHLTKFDDNEIKVDIKNKGLGIEPGFTVAAGDGLRMGLDIEAIYWRRWGLLTGFTVPVQRRTFDGLRGHAGIGYDLPSAWFSNTSIWGGIDTNRTPMIGLRTKFGAGK